MIDCIVVSEKGKVRKVWTFIVLPRVGEHVSIPYDPATYEVTKVVHYPDEEDPSENVELHVEEVK